MLANNPRQASSAPVTQLMDDMKKELGLDKMDGLVALGKLEFQAASISGGQFKVSVKMAHLPENELNPADKTPGEYQFTFAKPFTAGTEAEAKDQAVRDLYQTLHAYSTDQIRTCPPGMLSQYARGFASHVFNGMQAGLKGGNELNPEAAAHRLLNAVGYERQTLANVTWPKDRSLASLNLTDPQWNAVSAEGAIFTGTQITGQGRFDKCEFEKSRWSACHFNVTAGADPLDVNNWTAFTECNLKQASFADPHGSGLQGHVYFGEKCNLEEANLMYLGDKLAVRIKVLDDLHKAIESGTGAEIDQCEKEAKEQLKGLMWDDSLIKAAGSYGLVYENLLMQLSRPADPADVMARIKAVEIHPSQVPELLTKTPGVMTLGRKTEVTPSHGKEEVITIQGTDKQRTEWKAEVRISDTDVIRMTGPGGVELDPSPQSPKALRAALSALPLTGVTDEDKLAEYEVELGRLLGSSTKVIRRPFNRGATQFRLQLGDGIPAVLSIDMTPAIPADRKFVFSNTNSRELSPAEEALVGTALSKFTVNPKNIPVLDLFETLGSTQGPQLPVFPREWAHQVHG